MKRELYKHSFTAENLPDYLCPRCNKGLLRIKNDTLNKIETVNSKQHQEEEYSEIQDIEYTFNCVFECINNKCGEVVACTGHAGVDIECAVDYDNFSQSNEYYTYYKPLFFHPNLKLITIPEGTPADVERTLNKSFELFFTSPSAAANLVRISIEEILTDQGVERVRSLHRRIEKLPEKHQSVKDHLLALKWLGNAGSHSDEELSLDDTMDAYELVEYVLSKIYYSNPTDIDRLAKEINDFKGPKKKRFL